MIRRYRNWGEIGPEEFAGFLSGERRLSHEEQSMYANAWSCLVEDNSPLRAVINGEMTGVPEDFYDFLIWKRLTGKPVKQARLIGDILGYNPLGVGDWWYAARIQHHILPVSYTHLDVYKRQGTAPAPVPPPMMGPAI